MNKLSRARAAVVILCLACGGGALAYAQTRAHVSSTVAKEAIMTARATGTFDVKTTPQAADDNGAGVGRLNLDKEFRGDLAGTSKGVMLGVNTQTEGSAGYVAMERVTGTLGGRSGTFALQHSGTMTRGAMQLSVTVVPDSGTGGLAGLAGRMNIQIADGKHSYDFEYTLPAAH